LSGDTAGGEITFSFSFEQPETRVATDAAFNSTWENGDAIGIFAVRHASGAQGTLAASNNYLHNVKATYNSTTHAWTLDGGTRYFPAGTDQLDFYAYYPYSASATNPTAIGFTVQTDQSTAANYNKSDLLTATPATNVGRTTTPVSLTFKHALALVQVEFAAADASSAITLRNMNATATFHAGTGTASAPSNVQDIRLYRVGTTLFRALVPPQSYGATTFLLEYNGVLYNSSIAAGSFTAGAVTKFTMLRPR
jgi:hypothetical protein